MDPEKLFQSRRSIRRYTNRPISDATLNTLLSAARWAPSAHNRQPWRFAIVRTASGRHQLATAMGARLRAELSADNVPITVIDKDVNRSYSRITGAQRLIIFCLTMAEMDSYPDPVRNAHERTMAIQSTAMAAQNLLMAAHLHGLGACWMCAPLFCPDVVQSTLNLAVDWEPQGLVTLGYPDQTRERTRKPLTALTHIVD